MENKFMLMANSDGHVTIEEANIDTMFDNKDLLYKLAVKGKSIFNDLIKHEVSSSIEIVVSIIRKSETPKDACDKLQGELGIKKQTAEYILDLPLTEIGGLQDYMIKYKLMYFSELEKVFRKVNLHK